MSTATMSDPKVLRPAPAGDPKATAAWAIDEGLWPAVLRAPGEPLGDDRVAIGKEPVRNGWGDARPTLDSIRADFAREDRGVGLRLGPSGGWGDIEGDGPGWRDQFLALCGHEELDTLGFDSKRGGHNMVLPPPPALAGIPSGAKFPWSEFTDLEIRLNGKDVQSQSVIPPTTTDGVTRSWRGPWQLAPLPDAAVATLAKLWEEDQRRKRAATSAGSRSKVKREREGTGTVSTIDAWNREQGADGILGMVEARGWRLVKTAADGVLYVRHPEATGPWSASIGWCGDRLYCWSNNTAFPVGKPFDAFDVYRILEHGDDFQCALTALRERGYGPQPTRVKVGGEYHTVGGKTSSNGSGKGPDEPKPDEPEPEGPKERPIVRVVADMHLTVQEAVDAIQSEGLLYQRGNALVTVLRAPEGKEGRLEYRQAGSPRIVPVPDARLAEMLSRNARFEKWDDRKKDFIPTRVPDWCVKAVAARGEWGDVRPIEGVVEAPTIRPDGSILGVEGYDERTGLLYIPGGTFPAIPDQPTLADAEAAAARLLELVGDFPFKSPEHSAAWLAGLLTVAARFAILGPVPMFLFDANCPGAGKTWLADLIAIILANREMPRSNYSSEDVEMDKVILSVALAALRFVLFDNVPTGFRIGGGALDRALTGRTFQGRILGKSQMSPETPLDAVFFASGNNLGLRGDALRRIILCRLETEEERPEERTDFRVKDIKGYALRNRGAFLADALTILRAHAVAGRPESGLVSVGYPEWSRVVRDAIHWSTGLDPAAPRVEMRDDDDETAKRKALVVGWKAIADCSDHAVSANDAIRKVRPTGIPPAPPPQYAALHDLLCEMSHDGDLPSARKLGTILGQMRGRMTPDGAIEFRIKAGSKLWFVKPPRLSPGGLGGSGVSDSQPRDETRSDRDTQVNGDGGKPDTPNTPKPPPATPYPQMTAPDNCRPASDVIDPDDAHHGPAF